MNKNARILFVNLTSSEIRTETLDKETLEKYPGGSILGMYLLLKYMDPKIEPLAPENMLIFSVSPLTGIPISGQSRMCATFKSPLTGLAGDSQVGGFIPAAVAANDYMSIVITGKAETPVYLYIQGDNVEIRDASSMWGMYTGDAEKAILADLGDNKVETSIIGPAGENLVKFASIMHMRSRANGRNGVGAVMGSKNLKALAVHKAPPIKASDSDGLKSLTLDVKERMSNNETIIDTTENGSAGCVDGIGADGFLPSYNFDGGTRDFDGWEGTKGTLLTDKYLKNRETCFGCAIRCKRAVEIEGKVDPYYGGPEYETCSVFGSYCAQTDMAEICYANQLCNMYGMDTISCGATIAWAIDCYQNGLLTKEQTGGMELNYGDPSIFEPIIRMMGERKSGLGQLLAEGSARAAKELGPEAEALVVACKGQEWPAHMVQYKCNLAVNYAVNPFGADHQSCEHDPALMAPHDDQNWLWPNMLAEFRPCDEYGVLDDNKAKFAWETQKFYAMLDSLCLCQFAWGPAWQLYGPQELIEFCKYACEWDIDIAGLQEIGERRIVMMRLFNAKLGMDRKDDILPPKSFLPIEYEEGQIAQITREEFEAALDSYYRYAQWDIDTGIPTQTTISKLGLEWI